MVLKKYIPTSPGLRGMVKVINNDLFKTINIKNLKLKKIIKKTGGRNNKGRITIRHKGGGHKKYYRIIDFLRKKDNIIAKVENIEYDPNRNANIALICYIDGTRNYIIAPQKIKVGDKICSGINTPIEIGNVMPIKNIPIGLQIHCIELYPGKGAKIARSAGLYAVILSKGKDSYANLKLKSGEIRKIHINCRATIGQVSNTEYNLRKIGKAGISRHLGIRPTVRGVAMNPIDHPHGGGEGRTSGGRHPVTPWGKLTKNKKTRKNKRTSKFIIKKK